MIVESVIQIKSRIAINVVDMNVKKSYSEEDEIWNPATSCCQNGKYLASVLTIQ